MWFRVRNIKKDAQGYAMMWHEVKKRNLLRRKREALVRRGGAVKKWNIVRGDTVELIKGKDKGLQGVVERVLRKQDGLVVAGLNMATYRNAETGLLGRRPLPVHYSNVALVDPTTGMATKVRRVRHGGEALRVSRTTGNVVPKPEWEQRLRSLLGPKDTPADVVLRRTYFPPGEEP